MVLLTSKKKQEKANPNTDNKATTTSYQDRTLLHCLRTLLCWLPLLYLIPLLVSCTLQLPLSQPVRLTMYSLLLILSLLVPIRFYSLIIYSNIVSPAPMVLAVDESKSSKDSFRCSSSFLIIEPVSSWKHQFHSDQDLLATFSYKKNSQLLVQLFVKVDKGFGPCVIAQCYRTKDRRGRFIGQIHILNPSKLSKRIRDCRYSL